MALTIVEVLSRSEQGLTKPYICRGDDDEVYFVKGRSATRRGLVAEWLCACIGESFGLPIPRYAIGTVPAELIDADLTGWLRDLGPGEVFASLRVSALEFTDTHRSLAPEALRRDVLAFDWWVCNGDRNLTASGGNPNLLWNPRSGSAVVIDHNMAFDDAFSVEDFVKLHVFADDIPLMFSDFLVRQTYVTRFQAALGAWADYCDNLPDSWRFVDAERTIPVDLSLDRTKVLLDRPFVDSVLFWQLPQ
jgi:hypothetical protein